LRIRKKEKKKEKKEEEKISFVKLRKCEFWLNQVVLSSYVIAKDGITLDLSRI